MSSTHTGPAPVLESSIPPNVSDTEIAHFDALAAQWWDPRGPMRPLHAMNTLRIDWVTRRLGARHRVLDVGCGAGLAAEALARRGLEVMGLDAAPQAIEAARAHAAQDDVPVQYRCGTAEDLVAEGARFEAITALEVIEHVPDPQDFLLTLSRLLAPGGVMFVSTMNRTLASLAVAKIGAEYIARLLPVGTHQWRQFIPPAELATLGRQAGLAMVDSTGLRYAPLRGQWEESRKMDINYLAMFIN